MERSSGTKFNEIHKPTDICILYTLRNINQGEKVQYILNIISTWHITPWWILCFNRLSLLRKKESQIFKEELNEEIKKKTKKTVF